MKKKTIIVAGFILVMLMAFSSCEKDETGNNETKMSRHNDDGSHNNGQNCMDCHKSGGEGEGWFTVAGSVYDSLKTNPSPNGTIKLYTGPNATGTFVKTIEVDGRGNFYTTENMDFGNGLYPVITGSSGNVKNMTSSISTGQCNSCHGVTTDKIWVK
ncbi:MAG: hypothetical protein GXO86_07205 [Chlorobi bacterium]|nr:hypothetical protein [Chlorobiota bacterium]